MDCTAMWPMTNDDDVQSKSSKFCTCCNGTQIRRRDRRLSRVTLWTQLVRAGKDRKRTFFCSFVTELLNPRTYDANRDRELQTFPVLSIAHPACSKTKQVLFHSSQPPSPIWVKQIRLILTFLTMSCSLAAFVCFVFQLSSAPCARMCGRLDD